MKALVVNAAAAVLYLSALALILLSVAVLIALLAGAGTALIEPLAYVWAGAFTTTALALLISESAEA